MALKKPSDLFKFKEEKEKITVDKSIRKLVKNEDLENFSSTFDYFKSFSETLNDYRSNIDKVNFLSEEVKGIQSEIQNLLTKEDFEDAIMSQLCLFDQVVKDFQENVKGINQKNLIEIRSDVFGLSESVNDFLEVDVPKYKNLIANSELRIDNRFTQLEENVNQTLEGIGEFVDTKYQELTETLDKSLSDIVENSRLLEGDKTDFINIFNQKINDVNRLLEEVKFAEQNTEDYKNIIKKKVSDLELNIVKNESHLKSQNKNLEQIQEDIRSSIQKLNIEELEKKNYELGKKVKYLEEVFEKFNEKDILTENIIVEPPSTDNQDPLTPLNQNFVTLDQLQQHYRLFINRIQQQLATIGGGGETRLKYLDDIVGIATNPSAYNGKFLKYNHSIQKFQFDTVISGGSLTTLSDVNASNLSGISTDYIMVYDPSVPEFKFVNPKTYFGINNDANPAPDIDDYGSY